MSETVLKQSHQSNELRLKNFLTTDSIMIAKRETLDDTINFVYETYGDAAGYLEKLSVSCPCRYLSGPTPALCIAFVYQ